MPPATSEPVGAEGPEIHFAGAGETMVSSTVRELSGGSGFSFADRGEHELKGVPEKWRVYSVSD